MSGSHVGDFLGYWRHEGERYVQHGDYQWMAAQAPGQRILEIGCGLGFGTEALLKRGARVLALDTLPACLAATQERVAGQGEATLLAADVTALDVDLHQQIEAFAPETVVCWLMGAPASVTGAAAHDGGRAVIAYRERIHRAVAELAAASPTVQALHLVDRTAIPWQAKDIGRDTLVAYHLGKTLLDLPFTANRAQASYRKLEEKAVSMAQARIMTPAMKGVVPTLASLVAERKK